MKKNSSIKVSLNLMGNQFLKITLAMIFIKVISLSALKYVSEGVFKLVLLEAKLQGITNDNILTVLLNPIALILLLFTISIICIFIIVEIILLTLYFNKLYVDETFSWKYLIGKVKSLLTPSFSLFALYVITIMPNMNPGISTSFAAQIRLPRFIIDTIYQQRWMTFAYLLVLGWLFIINLFLFYAPTIFVLEDLSFVDSCKKSISITKDNIFRVFLLIAKIILSGLLFSLVTSVIVSVFSYLLNSVLPLGTYVIYSMIGTIQLIVAFIVVAFSQLLIYQVVVVSYQGEVNHAQPRLVAKSNRTKENRKLALVLLVTFRALSTFIYFYDAKDPLHQTAQIVSHRGDTEEAIENTLESLSIAASYKPDVVEMDVQMTQDEKLVFHHDFTLRRLGHDSRRVNELTFEEITSKSIRKGRMTSRIPGFEEYMRLAKDLDQKILVELKPDSLTSPDVIHKVVKVVQDLEMEDMVYYQSLDKQLVLDMKQAYPDTIVGYIIGFNIGRLEKLDIDFYSLEASAVSQKAVRTVDSWNKGPFVWTVNDYNGITTYLVMQINGIITDNARIALDARMKSPTFSNVEKIWQLLL